MGRTCKLGESVMSHAYTAAVTSGDLDMVIADSKANNTSNTGVLVISI